MTPRSAHGHGQVGEPIVPLAPRSFEDMRFVVVGAYVADCFVNTARLPAWGQEYEARSIRTSPGGKALNQAVALARLGAQVAAVGVVGDDAVGGDVLAALTRERVDVSWVEARADVATSICLCFVSDEGESAIMWHIDDDAAVTPETVRAATPAFAGADGVLVTFEMPVASVGAAVDAGFSSGACVVVQPAPMLADPPAAAALPWDQVAVLVPNEIEARALVRGDPPVEDLAEAVAIELDVPTVVVTLGASGCVTYASGVRHRYLANKVTALDTTGASDAFTATLAAYLTAGRSEPEAVDAAQTAAASAIQRAGGHESMPAPASPS
jgi:ribokinase